MARRPWVVFVRDIGPTYTFASEDRARQRAIDLTDVTDPAKLGAPYGEVLVWRHATDGGDWRERWVYSTGQFRHQRFDFEAGWIDQEEKA